MPLKNPYCTVDQVREYLRNKNAPQAVLEDAINAASRWIDEFKGRDYFEHDYTEDGLVLDKWSQAVFDKVLFLPFGPIITVAEVIEAGEVLVPGQDFKIMEHEPKLIRLGGEWPEGERDEDSITVKGRFGFEQRNPTSEPPNELDRARVPAGMPEHITQAAIQIAAAMSKYNSKDIVSMDGSKFSITETELPKSVRELLGARARVLI